MSLEGQYIIVRPGRVATLYLKMDYLGGRYELVGLQADATTWADRDDAEHALSVVRYRMRRHLQVLRIGRQADG